MSIDEESGLWKYHLLARDLTAVVKKTSMLLLKDGNYYSTIIMVTRAARAPLAAHTLVIEPLQL